MNFDSMTPKEVLNYAQPETQLEKRLFEVASKLLDENLSLQHEVNTMQDIQAAVNKLESA